MTTTSKAEVNPNPITIRLDDETRAELIQVAQRNDRTVSAEVRRAIRRHLEAEQVAA